MVWQERLERSKADVARIKGASYCFNKPPEPDSESSVESIRARILIKVQERAVVEGHEEDLSVEPEDPDPQLVEESSGTEPEEGNEANK